LLKQFENRLIKLESLIAAFSLLLMLLLSLVEIFTRNFFDFGFPEIEIINRNLLVVCGATGAVLATSSLRHIHVDALTPFLSKQHLKLLRVPLSLLSAVVCGIMAYYAALFCMDEWEFAPSNERWTLPFTLMYPFGFGLLSLHFLLICLRKDES
jgi:TRAP-type C4-dicarboxylate transport system permease small subunit